LWKAMRAIEHAAVRDEGLRLSLAGLMRSDSWGGGPCGEA
jgi:hypothetical protein